MPARTSTSSSSRPGCDFARHLHPAPSRRRSSRTSSDEGPIELIVNRGAGAIDMLPAGIKSDPEAVAETIANNIRKVIIDERAAEPEVLRHDVRAARRAPRGAAEGALDYKDYLAKLLEQAAKLGRKESDDRLSIVGAQWRPEGLVDFFGPEDGLAPRSTRRS